MTIRDFLKPLVLRGDQTITLEAGGAWRFVETIKLNGKGVRRFLADEESQSLLSREIGMIGFGREGIDVVYRMGEGQ